jgi:hypothetical protein
MMGSRCSAALAAACLALFASNAQAQSSDAAPAQEFGAVLRGGFAAAEPGGYPGQPRDTPSDGTQSMVGGVEAETAHVGVGGGWGASFGFELGWQPLLRMSAPEGAAVVRPSYTGGLLTAQTIRVGRPWRAGEIAVAGRAGATRIAVAGAAANDVAESALFFDARADLRWYGRDAWFARAAVQTLDPLVHAYTGVRHDQRFHRAGDLSEFDDPTGRLFFGFAVNPIRLANPHTSGSDDTRLTIGGAFEYEGALRGPNRLPSGYRLFAGASLNLVRALRRNR